MLSHETSNLETFRNVAFMQGSTDIYFFMHGMVINHIEFKTVITGVVGERSFEVTRYQILEMMSA